MGRIGIFFAEGYEEIEALTVVDILRRAGFETDMISINGNRQVTGSHAMTVQMDKLLEEVDFDALDMIVLPGGMPGTRNLEACERLMRQVDIFYETGRQLAAICAAPSILGHRGMLKGRKACAFPDFESHLEGAEVTRAPAQTDGNIITGRGMGCAIDFALAIVEKLKDKEQAATLADKIIYGHFRG